MAGHSIAGGILFLYVIITVFRGRITVSDGDRYSRGRSTDWITRAEKPVQFWLFVIVCLALAGVLWFNVFNLPF